MAAVSLENQTVLPTFDKLHISEVPKDVDIHEVATNWFEDFSAAVKSGQPDSIVSLLVDNALWRDILALTWDMRTFHGTATIKKFLDDRLAMSKADNVRLSQHRDKPITKLDVPGLYWIQAFFDFDTAAGIGSGIVRIVPSANGWKGHTVFTNLEQLKDIPYKVGPNRDWESNQGEWISKRQKEVAFKNEDPTVLIVGGGQSGLDVAARLKYLDVSCLVVDKHPRIGDAWRKRYKTLSLHDPVWYDHMPYLKFPDSWPVFTPAQKIADWLESYANSMELNVWTSSEVKKVERDDVKGEWIVTVVMADRSTRVMTPKYVVFALGLGGNRPNFPTFPGMDKFKGKLIHSLNHDKAEDYFGKKVVVLGACTSAHDISEDCYRHGIDVTMVQRSSTCVISAAKGLLYLLKGLYEEGGPPVEVADLVNASFPNHILKQLHKTSTAEIAEMDRETLEGLNRVGFKTNFGEDGSGIFMLVWKKAGGYYIDVGASQLIIDGKIKLKNGSVKEFTPDGLAFEDGSTLKADLVIFATGLGDARELAVELLGDEGVSKLKPLWGLTPEGELRGIWRECGLPNAYFVMGNLAVCRFHSAHLALQIKAKEVGLFTSAYAEPY